MSVYSSKGSIFTVTLPLKRMQRSVDKLSDQEVSLPPPQQQKLHILLVEDYPANILVATTFLDQFGYTYDIATTGAEAVNYLKGDMRYAAVLMDVQMPGINGYEATRIIRDMEKDMERRTPIIGMTANALSGDRERCLNAGMDDYIAKPFNLDELKEKIKKAVVF